MRKKEEWYTKRRILEYLEYYKTNPEKMKKVMAYSKIPNIFFDDYFLVKMIDIEDEEIAAKMITHFNNDEIKNIHDFLEFLSQYKCKAKKLTN